MATLLAPAAISVVVNDVLVDFLAAAAGLTEDEIKIYGPRDEPANNPAPPCVAWTLAKESWTAGQRQGKPGQAAALWTRGIPVVFEIFGGLNPDDPESDTAPSTYLKETDRSEALMAMLVNAFHRRLSQHGYKIIDGGWGPSLRIGLGMVYLLTVSFRLPLVREDNPTVTITAVNPVVEIEDA